jgi:hypothetical protein
MSFAACSTERLIEKPVPVEIVRVEYVRIPLDMLHVESKQAIPESLTYGQAVELWSEDRATIDRQNARLKAISELETP